MKLYPLLLVGIILNLYPMVDTTGDNQAIITPTAPLTRWQQCKQFTKKHKTKIGIGAVLTLATVAGLACDIGSTITAPQEKHLSIALPHFNSIPDNTDHCEFEVKHSCFDFLRIENQEQCEAYVEQDESFILMHCSIEPDGKWQYFGTGSILTRYLMLGAFGTEWLRRYLYG